MKHYSVLTGAEQDLSELLLYVAARNEVAASSLSDRVISAFALLARFPGLGRSWEGMPPSVLFWPVKPCLIAYRVAEEEVAILAVVHRARDVPAFMRQRLGQT